MNEHDLNRHLTAHAAAVEPAADADGLRKRMVRMDRNRRIRTVGAAGSMAAMLAFGFLSLGGSDQSTVELDVGGQAPTPVPSDPTSSPGRSSSRARSSPTVPTKGPSSTPSPAPGPVQYRWQIHPRIHPATWRRHRPRPWDRP